MKGIRLTLVALLVACSPIVAQDAKPMDPERLAAADELLRLFKVDQNMDAAFTQVAQMQEAMLAKEEMTDAQKRAAMVAMKESLKITREEMSWNKIGKMFVEIYAEVFSKEELVDLLEFYKSPIGQKFIEKQPQLQAATMQRMQGLMMQLTPKITEKVKAAAEQAKKEAAAE